MILKQAFKSKTIDFNLLIPAVSGVLRAVGVDLPPEAVVGVLAIGNIILRLFTKTSVGEKKNLF